ncbi:hypothetical protein FACS1894214_0060 [Planctomycetales bacterium]|nr:hypothetical protein FACS1894214_0060 [Planctomycetales bacterium]
MPVNQEKKIVIKKYQFFARFPDITGFEGSRFPVQSFQINASVNSVPGAFINLAVGKDIKSNNPINTNKLINQIKSDTKFHNVELIQIIGGTAYTVFIGYVTLATKSNHSGQNSMTIQAEHWCGLLAKIHPYQTAFHPDCPESLVRMLVPTTTVYDAYAGALKKEVAAYSDLTGVLLETVTDAFNGNKGKTFVKDGMVSILGKIYSVGQKLGRAGIFDNNTNSLEQNFPSGYSAENIFDKIIDPGDKSPQQLRMRFFENELHKSIISQWVIHPLDNRQTLWELLLRMASMLGLVIVPTVDKLLIVLLWPAGVPKNIEVLENYSMATDNSMRTNKAGRVRIIPSAITQVVDSVGTDTSIYSFPDRESYSDLWIRLENWQEQAIGITASKNNERDADLERRLYEAHAENIYYDMLYNGSQMEVVTLLDFNICPGATILIPYNQKSAGESDQTIGYVMGWQSSYNAATASATRTLKLNYCRPYGSPAQSEHKYFSNEEPFANYAWDTES